MLILDGNNGIDMVDKHITNVPTPITGTQAVNKDYVDNGAGATFVSNDTRAKTALNASGTAPIYACRAWVNFNGTGTVAIIASGNVSSITDNGVGSYNINFTTQMVDNNYAASGSVSNRGNGDSQSVILSGLASNGVSVYCQYGGDNTAGRFDPTTVCIQVVG